MARWECNNCGGIYEEVQPDGTLYFHACPPLTTTKVRLADGTEKDLQVGEPLPPDAAILEVRAVERPDRRDENIEQDRQTGRVRARAEGKGRTRVSP